MWAKGGKASARAARLGDSRRYYSSLSIDYDRRPQFAGTDQSPSGMVAPFQREDRWVTAINRSYSRNVG
jgi:hypothetical protein